jgi:hypothetical protein
MITADDAGGKLAPRITRQIQVSRPDPDFSMTLILRCSAISESCTLLRKSVTRVYVVFSRHLNDYS